MKRQYFFSWKFEQEKINFGEVVSGFYLDRRINNIPYSFSVPESRLEDVFMFSSEYDDMIKVCVSTSDKEKTIRFANERY